MTSVVHTQGEWTTAALAWARGPRIRELTALQREFILALNCVGRIAFMGNGRVELQPVHYAYVDGTIFGRTALGAKYLTWLVRNEVVFEIDESDGLFDWRSVVARGPLSILRPRGSEAECMAYRRAVAALRTIVPGALTERDPTPYRSIVFSVAPSEITGREATAG